MDVRIIYSELRWFLLLCVITSTFFFYTNQETAGKGTDAKNPNDTQNCKLAAIFYPSCHHDERLGDILWPDNTGEWEIIKKGIPHFDGHYQPKIPLWGYEMDNDPRVMEKWIDLAADHGIDIFIFDWFWFEKGPFLESSLKDGFLKAGNKDRMQFYIMWANHDVKKVFWNSYKYPGDNSLLWEGAIDFKEFQIVVKRISLFAIWCG